MLIQRKFNNLIAHLVERKVCIMTGIRRMIDGFL
jgi:hypothetical protein